MPTIKFDDLLNEQLKDKRFKEEFDIENGRTSRAFAVMNARIEAGLSQRELAQKADVPQSTIARIERGHNTSINTLEKIAKALNMKLEIRFI